MAFSEVQILKNENLCVKLQFFLAMHNGFLQLLLEIFLFLLNKKEDSHTFQAFF